MITGIHAILYAQNAEKARAFFRDVLEFHFVDAHDGWLIFALPPTELGVHPTDGESQHELYLMCEDINQTVATLEKEGVSCSEVSDAGWGWLSSVAIPGAGKMGIYQPRHKLAHSPASKKAKQAKAKPKRKIPKTQPRKGTNGR
jgi:catechol 2,3-dioxygenase-like lactoylglutathione lyase family enzyme